MTTHHPTAKRSPLCRSRGSGVRGRSENTTHLVNHKLPVLSEEGGPERSDWWGGEARIVIAKELRIPPATPANDPSPFTLNPSLSPLLVASGLRPMTERPQLPALADPSPKLRNSPLRLVIGEAPMPPTMQNPPPRCPGESRIGLFIKDRIPPDHPYPPTLHPLPFTLHPSLPPPLVASGLRPMTECPHLSALANPSQKPPQL